MFHAPSIQQEIPFEFRIRYKFLSQSEAVVRYGSSSDLFDLGRVSPGTYCTRQFEECYRNKCRLQSPNYPGMYPRNVTCYWTIRQKTVPTCKHAMIAVSQDNSHKSLVKRSIASLNKTTRTVRAWSGNQNTAEKRKTTLLTLSISLTSFSLTHSPHLNVFIVGVNDWAGGGMWAESGHRKNVLCAHHLNLYFYFFPLRFDVTLPFHLLI